MLSESLMMKLGERGYDLHGAIAPDMIAALRQRFAAALKNRKTDILQVSIVIDEIQQGLPFRSFEIDSADGNGNHVGSRSPVRLGHHRVGRIFAGSDNQT